jgi:hypothetical protein
VIFYYALPDYFLFSRPIIVKKDSGVCFSPLTPQTHNIIPTGLDSWFEILKGLRLISRNEIAQALLKVTLSPTLITKPIAQSIAHHGYSAKKHDLYRIFKRCDFF